MASLYQNEDILHPSTLQEAINIIKFLTTTHKQDILKWKNAYQIQLQTIKKLETNRKKELEFLSTELQKYEINLASRTEAISRQLAEKDDVIKRQAETIHELNRKLLFPSTESLVPEIRVFNIDSNSDSGIVLEHDEQEMKPRTESNAKTEIKNPKKCSRRLADSISFLKKVDFSPRKQKFNNESSTKTVLEQRTKLDRLAVPLVHKFSTNRHKNKELYMRPNSAEPILIERSEDSFVFRPKTMNDSMNNHLSLSDSDDSEGYFDRVMTRSSVRRSVNSNPKYKKINRAKSKRLEQVKGNILD